MATINSSLVTNFQASPAVASDMTKYGGRLRRAEEMITVLAAHNNADVYTIMPVGLDWRIADTRIIASSITGGTDYDFGLYRITNGVLGAVLDADVYADGISVASGIATYTSIMYSGAGTKSPISQSALDQKVWQDAGFTDYVTAKQSTDNGQVYLCATANVVGTADGVIVVSVDYFAGD